MKTKYYVLVEVIDVSHSRVIAYFETYAAAQAALKERVENGRENISISTRVM
jgi:hypothetical protein